MSKSNARIITHQNLTRKRLSKGEILTFITAFPSEIINARITTPSRFCQSELPLFLLRYDYMMTYEKQACVRVCSFTDLISPAVESWNLGGALQEAAAALSQMLGHPGVQRGDAT